MALLVKHPFTSAKADGTDATQVQPSNWNASHAMTAALNTVIGTDGGSTTAQDFAWTSYFRGLLTSTNISDFVTNSSLQTGVLTWTGAQTVNAKLSAGQDFYWTGVISPAALAANTNDWAPASFATCSRIRASSTGAINITGLAGGAEGRVVTLYNIGANTIILTANDASSSAANRFGISTPCVLGQNEGVTLVYDGVSSLWRIAAAKSKPPTYQVLTAGTGATYTTPAGCTWLKVRAIGAGGGGSAANGAGAGVAGGDTIFNSVTAKGGGGGVNGSATAAGLGGTGGTGGGGTALLRKPGNNGLPGCGQSGAGGPTQITFFGGAGGAGTLGGYGGVANTGGGGSGASVTVSAGGAGPGGGGGAGEYIEIVIGAPAATYTYTIGTGGASAGIAASSGLIVVEEYYN